MAAAASKDVNSGGVIFGTRVRDLVQELAGADALPSYNEEAVLQVIAEAAALNKEMKRVMESQTEGVDTDSGVQAQMVLYHAALKRNKRCLLAYHARRADLIEDLRWKHGAVLPAEEREKLSSAEVDYFKAYSTCISEHMAALGIDLMSDLQPPKEFVIQVVALRDCGRVMTTSGTVDVVNGGVYFMRRFDAEPLIRIGWLKELDSENM